MTTSRHRLRTRLSDGVIPPLWVRFAEMVAIAKLGLALLGLTNVGVVLSAYQATFFALHILAYGAAAGFLCILGRRDHRAVTLGICFLLIATVWSDRLLLALAEISPLLRPICLTLREAAVVAFAPYFLWLFVLDFPRPVRQSEARWAERAASVALVAGCVLFGANLSLLLPLEGVAQSVAAMLDRGRFDGLFWPVTIVSALAAVPYAHSQMRRSGADEKRRVQIVLAGLFVALMPQLVFTLLLSVSPSLLEYQRTPKGEFVTDMLVYPGEFAMPFVIVYAVLVHRALDVRLLVRRAIEYAMARYTIVALASAPVLSLFVLLYRQQDRPIGTILAGPTGALASAAIAGAFVLSRLRPALLAALDRRFYREQYDSRVILGGLSRDTRGIRDPRELAATLTSQIDHALHLSGVHALWLDPMTDRLMDPTGAIRPLPRQSRLVRRLVLRAEPVDIDVSLPGGEAGSLPVKEREWLLDAGVRLLVPMMTDDDSLVGLLALGEKLSGLPYTAEDRLLLAAMTISVSETAARTLRSADGRHPPEASEEAARKCLGCGRIVPPDQARCSSCGDSTVPTTVPFVLGGKFRLLEQLGAGGMGIVYKAEDVELGRLVAIKTLPGVAPAGVTQLRREARAMASVTHPNLAVIHGAESWRGVPMLVIEYLPSGTLADRLRAGPLPVSEVLEIIAALTAALERLHTAGLIHGDVKPSNIGFDELGHPKLLDFGLVRAIDASLASSTPPRWRSHRRRTATSTWGAPQIGAVSALVGTPLYFAPEQLQGRKPDVSTDLWALAMVMYEAMAGRHPFASCGLNDMLARISLADIPDIRSYRGNVPDRIAALLSEALHPDPHRRARSARELWDRIVEARRFVDPSLPGQPPSQDVAPRAPLPPVG